ncbi:DctP family TRAP transporter solute-binding subunit [Virgibacillus sp. 179-BFC.A HS]|uniref:DctP family TRAP transporter solute-binding subunit n=1 Tax=Tigheibacillus jepli TaxID=3035914 RepID=A0ABU5CGH7_9BACI|nr:DctP family TRAP transporter solute-binding subunit [Virgibacillus sp. 179-BFC.A HS]MDY0404650.1 DctP family TRAP transporter solute-binding subunit [Virgibacillus sp. 179-BFC.A HS]
MTVKVYPNGQLYGDENEIQALQSNNVQIIAPQTTKLAGFDESMELFDIPFLFKDEDVLYKFEDSDAGQDLLKKLEGDGIKGLAFWPNGFKHITNSEREIKEPSDLKGLKIRTHGGEILNDSYKQFGAASTKIAFNDVYQALQLGTIDGQENNLTNIKSQSYDEVQKYLSLTNHTRTEYGLVANKKWWDGLNDKTQKLVSEAVDAATKKGRELAKKESDEALKEIEAAGKMKVHELTEEEHEKFVEALKPVIDKWSKKMDSEIIQRILDMQK